MITWCSTFSQRLHGFRNYSNQLRIEGIKDTIAVASGKGGVGKTTTAVNLAVALAKKLQLKVGLLDADVYGPNVPIMMNIDRKPEVTEDKKMIPIENYGVKCMSIGFLVEKDAPIVWRGPMSELEAADVKHREIVGVENRTEKTLQLNLKQSMLSYKSHPRLNFDALLAEEVSNALHKMTRGVDWGDLDILVVDMPPGTGDTQIAISQNLQLSGAVIVSTPQDVALMDARRGTKMFNKVDVPILGIVENMSYFKCPHCSETSFIFGKGGTRNTASEMGLEFLGEIPIEVKIREGGDHGLPIVLSESDSVVSQAYTDVAQKVVKKLEAQPFRPEIIL